MPAANINNTVKPPITDIEICKAELLFSSSTM